MRLPYVLLVVVGCARQPATSANIAPPAPLDSLSVERGACYGTCEIYQFVVSREGAVVRRKADVSRVTLPPGEARRLLVSAADAGLFALPGTIKSDSTLCPLEASDHSTVIVTAYAHDVTRRIEHYTGCYISHDLRVDPRLERLVILERRIGALVSSTR